MKNIVLMGVKHCGKSTLGKMLAHDLHKQFYDIDNLIQEQYADNAISIREIHSLEKESGFKKLEAKVICSLSGDMDKSTDAVISLGGGTIENADAIVCISQLAVFVYLKEKKEILFERIMQTGIPPFLEGNDPFEKFSELYERRTVLYEKHADLIVDLYGLDIQQSFDTLKNKLMEAGYARK